MLSDCLITGMSGDAMGDSPSRELPLFFFPILILEMQALLAENKHGF